LKDKAVDSKAFEVPKEWMIDEKWDKGGIIQDMSCMMGGKVNKLTDDEIGILKASTKVAQVLDDSLDLQ
jgi:hypothetical protein